MEYTQVVKHYNRKQYPRTDDEGHFSPPEQSFTTKTIITGDPDPDRTGTSIVERHNLTMRMAMRWFTRLTNGFSKKPENHKHTVAFYSVWYNFRRKHMSLKTTPAVAAGLMKEPKSTRWIVDIIDGKVPIKAHPVPRRNATRRRSPETPSLGRTATS